MARLSPTGCTRRKTPARGRRPSVSFTRMPRRGLSSENGRQTVLAVLGEKKRILLEWSTVSYLFVSAKGTNAVFGKDRR
jgi:hypothetical protein